MSTTMHNRPIEQPSQSGQTVMPVATPVPSGAWRNLANLHYRPRIRRGLDKFYDAVVARLQTLRPRRRKYMARAASIVAMQPTYEHMSDARLREAIEDLRERFRLRRDKPADIDVAFALVRETAWRELGLRAHPEQVAAALAMRDRCLVELATGEGKTLSAVFPAVVAGWRGRGCHVVTVNDYLAKRDASDLEKTYRRCGLRVGFVDPEMDPFARRNAYAADVTYLTNKESAADFLRDRIQLGEVHGLPSALLTKFVEEQMRGPDQIVQRGLEWAIVDEADSVLIDEAVTPLIIASEQSNAQQVEAFHQACDLAKLLDEGEHFRINRRYRDVDLTRAGRERLTYLGERLGGIWTGMRRREELVCQAITARHLYRRDEHYIIQDEKVVIVDDFTGRLMPDREWRDGLHQAVSVKEGLEVQPPKATLARISFQRFFRLYRNMAGMTGTGWEGRNEFWQVYKLPVVRVPTHKPCIREHQGTRTYLTAEQKWRAVVEEIKRVHGQGRPILVGTRSVEASEHLANLLETEELACQILNAVRHAEEAEVVKQAGIEGRITVATNMAGRGTDIKLGREVAKKGGLHVVATERHESGRVDRQLFGRAGRQGDPGSNVAIVCFEDDLIRRHANPVLRRMMRLSAGSDGATAGRLSGFMIAWAQVRAQGQAQRQRQQVLEQDNWLDEFLGFAGLGT